MIYLRKIAKKSCYTGFVFSKELTFHYQKKDNWNFYDYPRSENTFSIRFLNIFIQF